MIWRSTSRSQFVGQILNSDPASSYFPFNTPTSKKNLDAQRKIWMLKENLDAQRKIWNKLCFGRGPIWHWEGYYLTGLSWELKEIGKDEHWQFIYLKFKLSREGKIWRKKVKRRNLSRKWKRDLKKLSEKRPYPGGDLQSQSLQPGWALAPCSGKSPAQTLSYGI